MKNQQIGSGSENRSASPFEQTQEILNNIIEQIKDLEWSECLSKLDKKNRTNKVRIIRNNIKTEHAEERETVDNEQIEAIKELKTAELFQRNCEYVRGLCKLTIEHKKDNSEAIKTAKNVLALLHKIESGDYSLRRKLKDTLFIFMETLRAETVKTKAKDHKENSGIKTKRKQVTDAEGKKIMITTGTSKENWEAIKKEYGVSKIEFGRKIKFVSDKFKRKIIFRDVEQAFVLASQGFSKPAVILAGGVIEELLRLYLEHKNIKPKGNRFVDYIQACEKESLLKRGVSRLSDSIRDFRNLVHLNNEKEKSHTISKATAKGAVSSIFTIANDFQ
jgi:hypothetical protein